ncbi:MAG: M6 family metalloprotease domain-containing protein [Bacteroidia bacterium]|nr:M6 family metalloprotease domain-containing protein [Bacteroidia bacterium]
MKKILLYCGFLILIFNFQNANAALLKFVPQSIEQPDKTIIHCYASGDEYFNWLHDANGYTIIRANDGWYYYAEKLGGKLIPSIFIVNSVDPGSVGLKPWTLISNNEYQSKRVSHFKNVNKSLKTPSSGTINNIVVYIRFSGDAEYTDQVTTYNTMFNSTASGTNSLKNYYTEASYSQLTINSTFYPVTAGSTVVSYQDSHPRNYYQPYDATTNPSGYTSSQSTTREHTLLMNAVNAIASQVPISLNIDGDNDGYVDNICFIIKGDADGWNDLLWPHMWSLYSYTVYINSKQVGTYNFQLQNSLLPDQAGVLCHEMFHSLGAPDLYHYDSNYSSLYPMAGWDVMEQDLNPAQHMTAYMKYRYGNWITSIPTASSSGTYTLHPLNSSTSANVAYKIPSPNSLTEYFVAEYRKITGTFESSLPNSGLIFYRINTNFDGQGNSNYDGSTVLDEVYVYRPFGTLSNNGTENNATFSSDYNRTVFNNTSNPSCFLSDGSAGGINISNITTAGSTISFTINVSALPNAFTGNATGITISSCVLNGIVNANNLATSVSFQYGLTASYGSTSNAVPATTNGNSNVNATASISGLTANTQYHFRIKAVNSAGTTYGNDVIFTTQCNSVSLPFTEDFEGSFLPGCWNLDNPDNSMTWVQYQNALGNPPGTSAVYINCFNYGSSGQNDNLITPLITLTPFAKLTFKVAYRMYDTTYSDTLRVFISTNGGVSYLPTAIYNKGGSALATGSNQSAEFFPASASDWRTDSISLAAYSGNNVLIKFTSINGYGNNIFLDDVSVNSNLNNILILDAAGSNISCFGQTNGSVNLTVTGGISPYSYLWSNGATTQDITGLSSGIYLVTVTSSNSLVSTATVTIAQPSQLLTDMTTYQVSCFGLADGSALASPSGGTSPYLLHWSNDSTSALISNIPAGDYILTVTDASSCTITSGVVIDQPPALVLSTQIINPTGTYNGSIDLTVTGGISPYSYSWSNGASTEDLNSLGAATYSVLVTDANNCTDTLSVLLTNIVGINESDNPADMTILYPNVPNPFDQLTEMKFYLPATESVDLSVYNILGEKIASLISGEVTAGRHRIVFKSGTLPEGSYFYILRTPLITCTKLMQLIRSRK